MPEPPLPSFLHDVAEIVSGTFALGAPRLVSSTAVPIVEIDERTGAVMINVAWVASVTERFPGDSEVAFAVIAGYLARAIQRLVPNGWMFPSEVLDEGVGACLKLMGVPRPVFERAVPAIAFSVEGHPTGFERVRRITEGYDSIERDRREPRRPRAGRGSPGDRRK